MQIRFPHPAQEEESEGRFGGRFASVALAKEGEAAENQPLCQQAETACPEELLRVLGGGQWLLNLYTPIDKKVAMLYYIYMNKTPYIAYALAGILAVGGAIALTAVLNSPDTSPVEGEIATSRQGMTNAALAIQSIDLGIPQNIRWSVSDFPSEFVKISIIRKTASNPDTYELVRTVSDKTPNDGVATWVPTEGDVGTDMLAEVGCTESTEACSPSVSRSKIAVNYSRDNLNTAALYQAIEQKNNNK
ncbi:MAG: hypothetical protein WCV79_01395 [Candidatus Paceibacterota bacterium]